ncbi:MAG TPA: response regulator transcription factor [Thermodesulfobacteriota bacterium]|nr:response regulator transcription factor [Thermodesulfobacteriota bacterium]
MKGNSGHIKVLVVSSHYLIVEGITSILSGEKNIKVAGQASNILELIELLYDLNPDIVIVHSGDGINDNILEITRLINQEASEAKVVLLIEDYNMNEELVALENGVRGYLPTRLVKSSLVKCIEAVSRGEMWVRREAVGEFLQQLFVKIRRGDYLSPSILYFNKREMEIIVLINKGYRNKEIARRVHLSEKTVKHYITQIFKKLNVSKRAEIKHYFTSK